MLRTPRRPGDAPPIDRASDESLSVAAAIRSSVATIELSATEPRSLRSAVTRLEAQVIAAEAHVTDIFERFLAETGQLVADFRQSEARIAAAEAGIAAMVEQLGSLLAAATTEKESQSTDAPSRSVPASVAVPRTTPTQDVSMLNKPLTQREREVLQLLALGLTDKDIAYEIDCTVRTTSGYVSLILHKLGVETRTAAVSRAYQRGLIS